MHENIIESIKSSLRYLDDVINEEPDEARVEKLRKWQKERNQDLSSLLDDLRDLEYRVDSYASEV